MACMSIDYFACSLLTYGAMKTMAPLTVHARIPDERSDDVMGWVVCQLVSSSRNRAVDMCRDAYTHTNET